MKIIENKPEGMSLGPRATSPGWVSRVGLSGGGLPGGGLPYGSPGFPGWVPQARPAGSAIAQIESN